MTVEKEVFITYLNGADIDALALSNDEILNAVESALRAQGSGQTVIEPRVHLIPESSAHGHFNVLRGVVKPLGFAGVKVVGDFVNNYQLGLPSEMAILNLFDPTTGMPKAILDATAITDMRTGAMTALGANISRAKRLAHPRSYRRPRHGLLEYAAARSPVRFFRDPGAFEASRKPRRLRRQALRRSRQEDRRDRYLEDCLKGADILVEASRLPAPEPLFKTGWIKKGAFVVPYGTMSAVELSLTDIMDKMVVDDWGQCRKGLPFGALRAHVDSDRLTEGNLHAELGQIVAGKKPGRQSDDETILFWHRGLSLSDIALGAALLDKAAGQGIGQTLRFR